MRWAQLLCGQRCSRAWAKPQWDGPRERGRECMVVSVESARCASWSLPGVKMKHYSKTRKKEKQLTQSLTHFPLLFLLAFFSRLPFVSRACPRSPLLPNPLAPSAPILPFLLLLADGPNSFVIVSVAFFCCFFPSIRGLRGKYAYGCTPLPPLRVTSPCAPFLPLYASPKFAPKWSVFARLPNFEAPNLRLFLSSTFLPRRFCCRLAFSSCSASASSALLAGTTVVPDATFRLCRRQSRAV